MNTLISRLSSELCTLQSLLTLCAVSVVYRFSPDERSEVRYVEDPELRFVMQRYREVHDFLHVLTELPPTVVAEVALKWFELVQTELPMCALSAFAGPLRLSHGDRRLLLRHYIPWACTGAAASEYMMTVQFEQFLEEPLSSVQAALRVSPCPRV